MVPLTWIDSAGRSRTARLTKTKAKPVVCNPLPMLAALVAWLGEFSVEALPLSEKNRPLLPVLQSPSSSSYELSRSASAAPLQRACSNDFVNNVSSSTSTSTSAACVTKKNQNGGSTFSGGGGRELSLGAAWLLGHLVFGREGNFEQRRVFGLARVPPNGKVCVCVCSMPFAAGGLHSLFFVGFLRFVLLLSTLPDGIYTCRPLLFKTPRTDGS